MSLLQAKSLCFDTPDGKRLVDDVSLSLGAGEVVSIIGPNGAGKSTLVKLLAGLRKPSSGQVLLDNVAVLQLPPQQRARRIGYLEQRPHLYWPLTVSQVISLGRLVLDDADKPAGIDAISRAVEDVGVKHLLEQPFLQLSEGEKLLVNLARILAAQPRLIIADEPTAALDPKHQQQVMQLLREQASHNVGVLLVLHELTLAARYSDRLILMHAGRVHRSGTPDAVLARDHLQEVYQLGAHWDAGTNTVIIDHE